MKIKVGGSVGCHYSWNDASFSLYGAEKFVTVSEGWVHLQLMDTQSSQQLIVTRCLESAAVSFAEFA